VLPLTGKGPTADPQPQSHLRDTGLGCSRFARHYSGNHSLFSFPQGTEMFHFPWFAPSALCIQAEVTRVSPRWVSPFGHLRLNVRLATPRSFSQPPTSFFASWHLGIHRTPLVAQARLPAGFTDSRPRSRPQLFAADPEECICLSPPLPTRLASRLRLAFSW
jgi:hypothetical protein